MATTAGEVPPEEHTENTQDKSVDDEVYLGLILQLFCHGRLLKSRVLSRKKSQP